MLVSNRFLGTEVADTERDTLRDRFSGASDASFSSIFRFTGNGYFLLTSLEGVYGAATGELTNSCLT